MGAAMTDRWSIKRMPTMNAEQFQLWQTLLEDRTGMTLSNERKTFLETSLNMRMRELGIEDYETYYEHLVMGSTQSRVMEWSVLVDRLTVQETSFFRHPGSYALVEEFSQRFMAEQPGGASLDVWSVGCSTGEEAYSLAIIINEQFSTSEQKLFYGITATDISLPTLAKARKGEYAARRVLQVDPLIRQKYFTPSNNGQTVEITRDLRERICFARLNVLDLSTAPINNMDLIFCQNMLIYFRRWRKRQILNRLAERLALGGILILGPGEVTDWQHPDLERVHFADTLAFRRCK
ncbi:MAG: methyltransferase [Alcanivorax borkumensis]|jgi:chemotaxis protein methyltransferase CheR/type IV pilus assembly protein PilK|uniref:protein-glutamate O-methyltransferase n=1 Tax=Alcanivorax borkumensis (strain ATCC 700651 / DSM 11573 / NCIMB 13689 / SK2) TaxID=393595 RepID=Q0VTJ0_ALCBS|nr:MULTISPECIES: protein-glutamate O-methyltransferase CheR [Alcanivorax]OJH08870.1 MAG: methyltransferase [Alcanivorax borkumensis]BAP12958.1 chemotaxis protein methyltransferase [Alcanivorax sp. NBRC 101098]CAL15553.1 Chemotaxis protein methyltransferase [Alcanivorax borkumensis SK2]